ncbi:MAG: ATP-dependent zinc metalloprotease FtsH, partial [Planctomycetota bacterium]
MANAPDQPPAKKKTSGQDNTGKPGPDGKPRPGGPNQPQGMGNRRGVGGLLILVLAVAVVLFIIIDSQNTRYQKVELHVFDAQLDAQNVKELVIAGTEVRGEFGASVPIDQLGEVKEFSVTIPQGAASDFLADIRERARGQAAYDAEVPSNWVLYLIPILPWILFIALIYFFFIRPLRGGGGAAGMLGNFGRSKHRMSVKEQTNVTFDDVAGVEEAKEEVAEIVEFLKNPKKFQRLGGRIPRGCLLVGPPGTGKTLLAKAIAGEADAPFFSISGSDFVEMFVGVGASRVRDLFKQAKENSPCIIFLDEIDAVGRRRGSGFSSGGHDEREQTLNAILVEMDGFDSNDQVIVIASTNRVDVLDPALTRPGRFDRQVQVTLPDVKGRMEILKVHARKIKLGPDVDLSRIARATPGFSGADLAACINEAALIATLAEKDHVEQEDLEEARDKVRFGRARKSRVIDDKEKKATAYHEAGHAVVQALVEDADPIHKVTIIPRGPYGGATMTLPEKDRYTTSRKWCIAFIKVCFGGRIAEEMFTGDVNSGVAGDIRQVTSVARHMVTEWGMND